MSMLENATNYLLLGAIFCLVVMIFLCFIRAIKGPRIADRIVAINMIGTMVIITICILALYLKESYLVDVSHEIRNGKIVVFPTEIHWCIYREGKGKEPRKERRRIMLDWIRFALAALFLIGGITIAAIATFGTYRFKYVLNRMHAAALVDTLAILLSLIGLMILSGNVFASSQETLFIILKLILVVLFLWFASPVSSHLISRLEVTTNKNVKEECEVQE